MTQRNYDIERPKASIDRQTTSPTMGEIYGAYSTLQQLEMTEPWAFGDKARHKDMKYTARAILELAGAERVEQVIADTHEWLAGKEM